MKPQNLLIDRNGKLKLADFNLSRIYGIPTRPYTLEVVTLWYRAPELLLGQTQYSTPVDIWSAGCILLEMITKTPLFPGDSEIDQLHRVFRTLGTPNENTWSGVTSLPEFKSNFPQFQPQSLSKLFPNIDPDAIDLLSVCFFLFFFINLLILNLKQMLVYEPDRRITAKNALQHRYFHSLFENNSNNNSNNSTNNNTNVNNNNSTN